MSTPFRTRVSTFDHIGPVWTAVLSPCNRCSEPGNPAPITHVIFLDSPPSPDGGELEIKAPCIASRRVWINADQRMKADAGRIVLVWTAEQVAKANTITPVFPDPNAPRHYNSTARIITGGEYR